MPSAGPQNAHQGSVGEGRGSEATLPSLQSKAGQAPVGLGTISHHWHRAAEAKAPASLSQRLAAATLPSLLFLPVLL